MIMLVSPRELLNDTRLNFLIGSGASKPHFPTLGNIEKALTFSDNLKDEDRSRYAKMLCARQYALQVIKPELSVGPISSQNPDSEVYETLLGYEFLFGIMSKLVTARETPVTSKTVNVFTTNYDTCIEHAFEDLGVLYNDGFVGHMNPRFELSLYGVSYRRQSLLYEFVSEIPSFNLFKLHGSLNWALEDRGIVLDRERRIARKCCNLAEAIGRGCGIDVNDLDSYRNHVSSQGNCKLTPDEEEFLGSYNELVLVSPTKKKFEQTLIDGNYYEMLRMMSNELEKENALLCVVGFSFADEHIREIAGRALVQNPTLTVVCFSYSENSADVIRAYDEFSHLPYGNLTFVTPDDVDREHVDIRAVAQYLKRAIDANA